MIQFYCSNILKRRKNLFRLIEIYIIISYLFLYYLQNGILQNKEEQYVEELEEILLEPIIGTTQTDIIEVKTIKINYNPTQEEREFAEFLAYAEAGNQGELGQIYVINAAINNMREMGYANLIKEGTSGRYTCVKNGKPCVIRGGSWIPVSNEDISEELKKAVNEVFLKDYTEELLKKEAENIASKDSSVLNPKYYEGGAMYFYNPKATTEEELAKRKNIKVKFKYKDHVFYRYWDK